MKTKQQDTLNASRKNNPIHKLIKDKERIEKAIREHGSLASIKGVKFVQPLKL